MSSAVRNRSMTQGGFVRPILLFAFPILLSNFLQQMYNTLDTVVVGRFVGSTALAAVGSTGSLINLVIGFFIGLSTGTGVVISQAYGAGDHQRLHKAVHTGMAISIASAVIIASVGVIFAPTFLHWMGTPDDVLDSAVIYLRILFGLVIFMTIYNMGSGILRAIGDSRRPLVYLAVCAVLNVILNLIFVCVFHMGVAGVAWATVLAQAVSTALILFRLMRTQEAYRIELSKIRFHKEVLAEIIRIGLPAGIQSTLVALSNVIIQGYINSFGSIFMAANAAAGKIDAFIFMPINALALTATTFTGQNVGAGQLDRVKKGMKTLVLLGIAATLILGIPIFLFSDMLVSLINGEAEVIRYGSMILRILAPLYFTLAVPEILSGIVRGAGVSLPPMLISLCCMCLLRIVWLTITVPLFQNPVVIPWCYPFTWTCYGIVFILFVKKSNWLRHCEK